MVFTAHGHFPRFVVEAFLEALGFQCSPTSRIGVCKFQLVRRDAGPMRIGLDRFHLSATRAGMVSAQQIDANVFGRFGKDRRIIPDEWDLLWQRALYVDGELGATPDADEVRAECTRPPSDFAGIPGYDT